MSGITSFQFNALRDQLQAIQRRLAHLERRLPTGDPIDWGLSFDSTTNLHLPALDPLTYGKYVRMNGLLVAWAQVMFSGAGAGTISTGNPILFRLPYPVETIVMGIWRAIPIGFPAAQGQLVGRAGEDRIQVVSGAALGEADVITARGLSLIDLEATIAAAGVIARQEHHWASGDQLRFMVIAQMPPGS